MTVPRTSSMVPRRVRHGGYAPKRATRITVMIRIPTDREPTHPGELLLEDFLVPLKMSQHQLATAIHVPEGWVTELVQGQRSMTPSIALRLAKLLGMSPDFWMNLQ